MLLNPGTKLWELILVPFFSFTGKVRSLSSSLWSLTHLYLYLSDNSLSRIPSDIAKLHNLVYLDLSSNKIRSLPAELPETWYHSVYRPNSVHSYIPLKQNIIISLGNTTLLGNNVVNLMLFEQN